ncbi:hypothetical protein IHV09_09465 [Fictibacillus sp. 23RED33]|nr:hypothetical protein [Fictibacillus sp. 23RED33]
MKKLSLSLITAALLVTTAPGDEAKAFHTPPVMWEGMELKKGQVGKVTIMKPINLWKRENGKLVEVRVLKPGEGYRVYGYDKKYGGQYAVGANHYITNIPGYVSYKTPSKAKWEEVNGEGAIIPTTQIKIQNGKFYANGVSLGMPPQLTIDILGKPDYHSHRDPESELPPVSRWKVATPKNDNGFQMTFGISYYGPVGKETSRRIMTYALVNEESKKWIAALGKPHYKKSESDVYYYIPQSREVLRLITMDGVHEIYIQPIENDTFPK